MNIFLYIYCYIRFNIHGYQYHFLYLLIEISFYAECKAKFTVALSNIRIDYKYNYKTEHWISLIMRQLWMRECVFQQSHIYDCLHETSLRSCPYPSAYVCKCIYVNQAKCINLLLIRSCFILLIWVYIFLLFS